MDLEVTGFGPLRMSQLAPEGPGSTVPGPAGVRITYEGLSEFRGADIPSVAEFAILLLSGISAQLIATGLAGWIDEKFRGRSTKVAINRRVIDFDDQGQVRRIVEEEITREWPDQDRS